MTTTGKLVLWIAKVEKKVATNTAKAAKAEFLCEILTLYFKNILL